MSLTRFVNEKVQLCTGTECINDKIDILTAYMHLNGHTQDLNATAYSYTIYMFFDATKA